MNACFPRSIEPWEKLSTESGRYEIFGSQIQFMELILLDDIQFDINVVGYGQDYALTMWLSLEPYGTPITFLTTNQYSLRQDPRRFIISTIDNTADYTLPSNLYYLNIQNRTNSDNIWNLNFLPKINS